MIRRAIASFRLWLDELLTPNRRQGGRIAPMEDGSLLERCAKVNIANSEPKSALD